MTTSPVQSSSSQSSQEAGAAAGQERQGEPAATRPTLVETLRSCLTSTTTAALMTPPAALAYSDPGRPAAFRQSPRGGGASSGSGSRTGVKRRSRASRRIPTTVVETTPSDFRETVHRLTGMATPAPAPVRPQPKRPNPSTFILPTLHSSSARPPPDSPRPNLRMLLSPHLNITAPPMQPDIWQQSNPFIQSDADPGIGASSQPPYGMTLSQSQSLSASTSSIPTWSWDTGVTAQSQSFSTDPATTIPFNSPVSSGEQLLPDDFDVSWFHPDHPDSDYMP